MSTPLAIDTCCTLVPYFRITDDKVEIFREIVDRFVKKTQTEPKCLYYGFSFSGNIAHCREGYVDAEGVLQHLENVGDLLTEALQIAELIRLEIHGIEAELTKLREPLSHLPIEYFTLETGFRR